MEDEGEDNETRDELLQWAHSVELYDLGGADTHQILEGLEEEKQNDIRHVDMTTDELSDSGESHTPDENQTVEVQLGIVNTAQQRNQTEDQTGVPPWNVGREVEVKKRALRAELPDFVGARAVDTPRTESRRETPQTYVERVRAAPTQGSVVPGYNTLQQMCTTSGLTSNEKSRHMASKSAQHLRDTHIELHSNTRAVHAAAGRHAIDRNRPEPSRPPEYNEYCHSHEPRAPPALGSTQHK